MWWQHLSLFTIWREKPKKKSVMWLLRLTKPMTGSIGVIFGELRLKWVFILNSILLCCLFHQLVFMLWLITMFIICAEGLSSLIRKAEERGLLHGIKICRGAPIISHMLFTDDSIIFCKATKSECTVLKDIFKIYELASCWVINFKKSGIFFTGNVPLASKELLFGVFGVGEPLNTGKCLGLPSLIEKKKRAIFNYLRDRVWKKTQLWWAKRFLKLDVKFLLKLLAKLFHLSACKRSFYLPPWLMKFRGY